MEKINSSESRFQKKCYKINSSKNYRKNKFISRQDNDIVQESTICPENMGKKRKIKFNHIDNTEILYNNLFNNHLSSFVAKEEKNNIPKNENMITEYLTKLYDEPHLRKSLFRKKTTNIRNPNQKVSFAYPINLKTKQNLNLLKLNKNIFKKNNDNINKSNIFNNNDILEEQCYGYDKVYIPEIIDNKELMLKREINTKNKNYNPRRKQTSQTIKTNNKQLFNLYQVRNLNRKNTTNNINNAFYINSKKKLSSKSINKRLKSKTLKDKNNIDKNYDKIININNNININNDIKKNHTKKSKKRQDDDNIETAIQKEVKDKRNKMKKKRFCGCFPFLICLKQKNDEENESIL